MSDPNAQTKKRQAIILGGAAVGILGLLAAGMFLFDPAPPQQKQKPVTVSLTPPGTVDDKDAWRATESARAKETQTSLGELQAKLRAQDDQNKKLAKDLDDLRLAKAAAGGASGPQPVNAARAAEVLEKPLPVQAVAQRVLTSPDSSPTNGRPGVQMPQGPVSKLNQPINGPAAQAPQREPVEMISFGSGPSAQSGQPGKAGEVGDPQVLGFPVNERAKKMATAADPKDEKGAGIEFIPGGSFVRVAMLNGVDAPTGGQAQSNPLPIAFQVLDVANLANKYRLDIRDCRIIAAAWGDLSSERTFGRTETLTCIINGETVEMAIKGTVIGEDGKAGLRGRLVTKQGQLLANALFAGALSGIGKAFQAAATTTTSGAGGVTQTIDASQVGQAAIGGGVSSAASTLANYYLKAADKLFPVIETDGGRVVEILITKGAVYKGNKTSRDQYRGLLRRAGSTSRSNDDD